MTASYRYACAALGAVTFISFILAGSVAAQSADAHLERVLTLHPELAPNLGVTPRGFNVTADAFKPDMRSHRTGDLEVQTLADAYAQVWLLHQQRDQIWDSEADNSAGDWVDETRVTYTRNSAGFSEEYLIEEWDVDSQSWMPSFRQTWERTSENRTSEVLSEGWDLEADAWVVLQRRSYTYNAQGNMLTSTTEFWDEENEEFYIWFRSTRTYDSSGEVLLERVTESGLFGPLEPSFRYTYSYDDGNESEVFVENYDGSSGTWVNYELEMSTYDANGALVEQIVQDWDSAAGDWVNVDRETTTFSPNSNAPVEVVETEQVWDPETGDWLNEERITTTFSPDATAPTEIVDLVQEWDAAANDSQGDWLNVERESYEFTTAGNLLGFLYEEWDAGASAWVNLERGTAELNENGLRIVQLTEEWDGTDWMNLYRSLLSYEEFASTAAEDERPGQRFRLDDNYPNPFSRTTTIRFALERPEHVTLEIFDILGRRVSTLVDDVRAKGSHEVTLNGDGLAGGLYVYRLSSEHVQTSRTLLIVK